MIPRTAASSGWAPCRRRSRRPWGWACSRSPHAWSPAVSAARRDLGQPVGLVAQRAIATYLEAGALRLHTQRMRNRYRRRRALVVSALGAVPGAQVYPMDGGLHAVVETARPEAELVAALAGHEVQVSPLSEYWSGGNTRSGIVFGFGAVSDADLAAALCLVAAELSPTRPKDELRERPALNRGDGS